MKREECNCPCHRKMPEKKKEGDVDYEEKYIRLRAAVGQLYYESDRSHGIERGLWERVREAAGLIPRDPWVRIGGL